MLTPRQVATADKVPLPPKTDSWPLELDDDEVEFDAEGGRQVYDGDELSLEQVDDDSYMFHVGGKKQELGAEEPHEGPFDPTTYVPNMDDIVDSMEEFEAAREADKGTIAMVQATTLVIDGVEVGIAKDRTWGETTYQATMTFVVLFQDAYEHRPGRHDTLEEMYGEGTVERAMAAGADD